MTRRNGLDGELDQARGAALDRLDDAGEQGDLLGGLPAVAEDGAERTGRAGRPKGSRNRSTTEMVRFLHTFGQGPLVGAVKIVNTVEADGLPDIRGLAQRLGVDREDALKVWIKCAELVAPYMAQKLPTAVHVSSGADREILIIDASRTIDDAPVSADDLLGGAFGGIIDVEEADE